MFWPVTVMVMPLIPQTEGTTDTMLTDGTTYKSNDDDDAVAPSTAVFPCGLNITTTAHGPPDGAFTSATTTAVPLIGVQVWPADALIVAAQLPPCAGVAKLVPTTVIFPLGYTNPGLTLVTVG